MNASTRLAACLLTDEPVILHNIPDIEDVRVALLLGLLAGCAPSLPKNAHRALAAEVAGAGLVYFSGGNPGYLAASLRDTALWWAVVEAWQAGAALAGWVSFELASESGTLLAE